MLTLELITEIIAITSSGALSPGPLTFATIAGGIKNDWKFGLYVAVGHTLFEFPLVIVLSLGASSLISDPVALRAIGLLGGFSLIAFALLMLRDALKMIRSSENKNLLSSWSKGGLITGLLFTALNPYFIIWWASAGLKIVVDILSYGGLPAVFVAYPVHVWMDYVWLIFLAYASSKGRILGRKSQIILLLVFSIVLVYYGARFILLS